ncbi:putative transcriptional regulator [Clostridium sp. CAG:433]|jgi:transcriptional regulator with XRE-family HTH domain|nr:putative transcriptional regulator [Clostridium sp. CAG:433]
MANSDLKNVIENARKAQGYSQRQLAKQIGLSQSTYNDTINGKIKKVDVEILRKIAEGLNLSLDYLLKFSGYGDVYSYMNAEKYSNKSTKDFVEMLDKYEKFKMDILDWDYQKRQKAFELQDYINNIKTEIRIISAGGVRRMTDEELLQNLDGMYEITKKIAKKYDYSKLPKDL